MLQSFSQNYLSEYYPVTEECYVHVELMYPKTALLSHGSVHNYYTLYSAQLMLDKFSLVELLAMDLHQLQDNLPWMPVKILNVSIVYCWYTIWQ